MISTENEKGFMLAWVKSSSNPLYKDISKIQFKSQVSGSEDFLLSEIELCMKNAEQFKQSEQEIPLNSSHVFLASEIFKNSNGCTEASKFSISGEQTGELIEVLANMNRAHERPYSDSGIRIALDISNTLGYALAVVHGIDFASYQLGVLVEGQGIDTNNFEVTFDFKLTPKNVI